MKIRNGFVSNSSSSSFIIFGKRLNEEDLREEYKELVENKSLYAYGYNSKASGGDDYFPVTEKMAESYLKYGCQKLLNFVRVDLLLSEGQPLQPKALPNDWEEYEIINISASHYYKTSTYRAFAEDYLDINVEVPEDVQKAFNKKLEIEEKIQKLEDESQEISDEIENGGFYVFHDDDGKKLCKFDW